MLLDFSFFDLFRTWTLSFSLLGLFLGLFFIWTQYRIRRGQFFTFWCQKSGIKNWNQGKILQLPINIFRSLAEDRLWSALAKLQLFLSSVGKIHSEATSKFLASLFSAKMVSNLTIVALWVKFWLLHDGILIIFKRLLQAWTNITLAKVVCRKWVTVSGSSAPYQLFPLFALNPFLTTPSDAFSRPVFSSIFSFVAHRPFEIAPPSVRYLSRPLLAELFARFLISSSPLETFLSLLSFLKLEAQQQLVSRHPLAFYGQDPLKGLDWTIFEFHQIQENQKLSSVLWFSWWANRKR